MFFAGLFEFNFGDTSRPASSRPFRARDCLDRGAPTQLEWPVRWPSRAANEAELLLFVPESKP